MAKVKIKAGEDYAIKLAKMGENIVPIAKKAVYKGAEVLADAVHLAIKNLPEESHRILKDGDKFKGITPQQKQDLLHGLGIAKIRDDRDSINTSIGFNGYGTIKSRKYPKGLPIILLMRSIESGSSIRTKNPIIRKTKNKNKAKIIEVMNKTIAEEIEKIK